MIYHSLICMLSHSSLETNAKTLRVSMNPSEAKIEEVYLYNLNALNNLIKYCKNQNIKALRVSSSIFPLLTFEKYSKKCYEILDKVISKYEFDPYMKEMYLSSHPDQFILLSSINPGVNEKSIIELESYSYIRRYIPINLINLHVGSRAEGGQKHTDIFLENFNRLSTDIKKTLSLENDEKSYDFNETLNIAKMANCMMVPDFHHHRCFHRRKNEFGKTKNEVYDKDIYNRLSEVDALYSDKLAPPTFHISSPKSGWCGQFKPECEHSDYIEEKDYPKGLIKMSKNKVFILDIEAKAKEQAVLKLGAFKA